MFWGLTPALNFFEELQSTADKTINILLVGGSDARHILKTISKKYQHQDVNVNFYVMELVPEVVAKQLLLLNIALQPEKNVGMAQKTRMFMEIYGNTLVRPATAKYLMNRALNLINMITNLDRMAQQMPNVSVALKYKERDYIENIFKFWVGIDKFDILDCWDRRLRKSLGVRYDTRYAAFDWDLYMRLHDIGGKFINSQEYQSFRRNGVSFSWLENEVTKPNRSMVTGVIPNGDHFGHYGYLGDMQTGPFVTFGIHCADAEFNKKANNTYKYRATDVTERNLREIFHEIEFADEYSHHGISEITLGTTIMQISELKVIDTGNVERIATNDECFHVNGVSINVLSISDLSRMQNKSKYKDYFNVIYFANNCVKHISKEVISHVAKQQCLLIIENQLFILNSRDKELEEHYASVDKKLEGIDKYQCPLDIKKDSYIKYILV